MTQVRTPQTNHQSLKTAVARKRAWGGESEFTLRSVGASQAKYSGWLVVIAPSASSTEKNASANGAGIPTVNYSQKGGEMHTAVS